MSRREWFFGLLAAVVIIITAASGVVIAQGRAGAQDVTVSSLSSPISQSDLSAAAATNLGLMDQRIQGGVVTLNASGVATWTFTYPYASPPVVSYIAAGDAGAYPVQCNYTSVSATAVSIKCYKGSAITVAVLGVAVNAFQGSVTGVQVHMHARPLTQ